VTEHVVQALPFTLLPAVQLGLLHKKYQDHFDFTQLLCNTSITIHDETDSATSHVALNDEP
jgi:hypothetical protein